MPHFRRLQMARLRVAVILAPALVGPNAAAQPQDPAPSEAAQPALRMSWQSSDSSCNGDDVAAHALRSVSPGVTPRPLRAQVDVQHEGTRWVVKLQTESGDQSGRRILRAESCDEIRRAVALLLAMAMESRLDSLPPEPAVPPAQSSPAPAPDASPARGVSTDPDVAAAIVADTPSPAATQTQEAGGIDWGPFVRLDGKLAQGLKPGLGLGAGLSAGLHVGRFEIGVSGAIWPNTRARVLDREGRLHISRQNVGLRACWNVWAASGWVLAPCLSPELTFFRYASERVETSVSGTAGPLPSVSAAVDLRYELIDDRLSILISPAITWERSQPFRITLEGPAQAGQDAVDSDVEEIYKTTGLGPRLEIGVDARF